MTQTLSSSAAAPAPLTPVAAEERIEVLDALRGLALLGIILINIGGFREPAGSVALVPRPFQGFADRATEFVMDLLVTGKANSIFSFLFGLGLAIQMQRADAKGRSFVSTHLRRMGALLAIALAHAVLIWDGDVLHVYAVLGLVVMLLRRASDRTLLVVILLCLLAPRVRGLYMLATDELPLRSLPEWAAVAREHTRIFGQGTWGEQIAARLDLWAFRFQQAGRINGWLLVFPSFLVTVLMGFIAGRRRILSNIADNASHIRKLTIVGLCGGFATSAALAVFHALWTPTPRLTLFGFFFGLMYDLNRPLLLIGYVGAVALLMQTDRFRRYLAMFADAGRMPLTNYLMQSLIATAIFYSWGLGLFFRVGPLPAFFIALGIFAVQVVYSKWWLARFQYGPIDYLWRALSYGRLPRMRVARPAPVIVAERAGAGGRRSW